MYIYVPSLAHPMPYGRLWQPARRLPSGVKHYYSISHRGLLLRKPILASDFRLPVSIYTTHQPNNICSNNANPQIQVFPFPSKHSQSEGEKYHHAKPRAAFLWTGQGSWRIRDLLRVLFMKMKSQSAKPPSNQRSKNTHTHIYLTTHPHRPELTFISGRCCYCC